jgi:hypothetical protein
MTEIQTSLPGTYVDVGSWRPSSTLTDESYTPQWFLDFVEEIAPIDTDPCWSPMSLVRPQCWAWTHQQRGETRQWFGHAFANPGYSSPDAIIERCIEHAGKRIGPATLLLRLDPSTGWAQRLANFGRTMRRINNDWPCFFVDPVRRINFHQPFKKKKGSGNDGCNRCYILGHDPNNVLRANKLHQVGDLQILGGIQ